MLFLLLLCMDGGPAEWLFVYVFYFVSFLFAVLTWVYPASYPMSAEIGSSPHSIHKG